MHLRHNMYVFRLYPLKEKNEKFWIVIFSLISCKVPGCYVLCIDARHSVKVDEERVGVFGHQWVAPLHSQWFISAWCVENLQSIPVLVPHVFVRGQMSLQMKLCR